MSEIINDIFAEDKVRVSVIIPAYRDTERLRKCLKCLERQTLAADLFEIIVVNNDPDEGLELSSDTHNLIVLEEPRPGSYAARNRGLEVARGAVIAFTDSDCLPDADWLAQGLAALAQSGADRVAGQVRVFATNRPPSAVECYETFFAFDQPANVASGVAITANLIARAVVFEAIGAFDDTLLSGGDVEWNQRATVAGFSLSYVDGCRVLHPARSNWDEISRKASRVIGGKIAIDPEYSVSLARSLMPPVEACIRILKTPSRSLRDKVLAFYVAYRLKVYRYSIHRRLRLGTAHAER